MPIGLFDFQRLATLNLTLCDDLCDCDAMNTQSNATNSTKFLPVFDSRKRKIRGLIRRGDKFYAQMRITQDGKSRPVRIPLEATSLDAARSELEKKRTESRKGDLHRPGVRPTFEKLVADYERSAQFQGKKEATQGNEIQALNRWLRHLGTIRIDWIGSDRMSDFRDERRREVSARTCNLDMIAFNNAMSYAIEKGWLSVAPKLKRLKEREPAKRTLLTAVDIERLLEACDASINEVEMRFYIRFLVLTGSREQEALRVKWSDVDLWNQQIVIGASHDTKNSRHRSVNFTPELKELLHEMSAARPPDSSFLFPSPHRGSKDINAKSLRNSFLLIRAKAGQRVNLHDFRHFFASTCVMAGIDFMTISRWLGHSDGGILVGKVYGHLADDHKSRMAANLSILKTPANVRAISAA